MKVRDRSSSGTNLTEWQGRFNLTVRVLDLKNDLNRGAQLYLRPRPVLESGDLYFFYEWNVIPACDPARTLKPSQSLAQISLV